MANQDATTFDVVAGTHITGTSTAYVVHYAVVMSGAVLDEGDFKVIDGKFDYFLNPSDLHSRANTYDVTNRVTGRPELGDVRHVTLFSNETTNDGEAYHSFLRVGVRGGGRLNTLGRRERTATAGVTVTPRAGLYLEAYAAHGGSEDDRDWGVGARLSF